MKMNMKAMKYAFGTVAVVALATSGISGCSALKKDAWALTYEVTVPGDGPVELTDIAYTDQDKRGEDPKIVALERTVTGPVEGLADVTVWQAEAMLEVGLEASISATAPAGSPATCRILLDGGREIASNTGAPGGTVTCEATTPQFEK